MLRTKTIITTKADLLDDKIAQWLGEHPDISDVEIKPLLSYTTIRDKGAYMVGCMIVYETSPIKSEVSTDIL